MGLEATFNYIDDLVVTNPNNSPDQVREAANHLRGTKNAVKGSFPNLGQAAVTKTAAEINDLTQSTGGVLNLGTITDATFVGTQTGFVGDITGNASGSAFNITGQNVITNYHIADNTINAGNIAANAVGNSELGTDAVQAYNIAANAVGASEIATNAVGASEIAANAVRDSEIYFTNTTSGTQAAFPWTPPAGLYAISWTGTDSRAVSQINGTTGGDPAGAFFSDGVNTKIVDQTDINGSLDLIIYYRKLA